MSSLSLPFVEQGSSRKIADRLNDTARNHFVACTGEFIGTFLFLFSAFNELYDHTSRIWGPPESNIFFALSGTQVANTISSNDDDLSRLLYISLCFGFSLAVNAWVWFRVSGGLFNPAVTLGMCPVKALPWDRGALLSLAQLAGSVTASLMVNVSFPGHMTVLTTLNSKTSILQGYLIESFLTFQLVITIMMLAGEKHAATFIAPVGIGLSLFIAELSGVYFTGGSLNPARSFGPALILGKLGGHHWIYWVGPCTGAVMAAGLYKLLKILDYEKANPGQDATSADAGGSGRGIRLDS